MSIDQSAQGVSSAEFMQRFDELLEDYGGARGEVAFFNATQKSGMTVRLPRPRLIALQEHVAAVVSERDALASRVRALEGALNVYVTAIATAGGGDKQLFMAALRQADDMARAALTTTSGDSHG